MSASEERKKKKNETTTKEKEEKEMGEKPSMCLVAIVRCKRQRAKSVKSSSVHRVSARLIASTAQSQQHDQTSQGKKETKNGAPGVLSDQTGRIATS